LTDDEKKEIVDNVTEQVGSELLGAYVRLDAFNAGMSAANKKYQDLKDAFDGMEPTVNQFGTYVGATGFSQLVQNAEGLNLIATNFDLDEYHDFTADVSGLHSTVYGESGDDESGLVKKMAKFENTLEGITAEIGQAQEDATSALTQLGSLTITPDQIVLANDANKKLFDENGNLTQSVIESSGLLTTASGSTLYAAKSDLNSLSDNVDALQATVDAANLDVLPDKINMAVMAGQCLMNDAGEFINTDGDQMVYFYTPGADEPCVPEGESPFVWYTPNSDPEQFWVIDAEGHKVSVEPYGEVYQACQFDTEFEHEGETYRAVNSAILIADAVSNIKLDSNSIELYVQDALENQGGNMASIMLRAMDDDSSIKIHAKNIDIDGLVNNLTAKKISTSDSGIGHIDVQDNYMQMYSSDGNTKLVISSDDVPLESGINRYAVSALQASET